MDPPSSFAPTATPSRPTRSREPSLHTGAPSLSRQRSSNSLLQTPARTSASTATPATGATLSPAYQTSLRSRHSLYGTEDRIILDLGSRVWKIGFSGETNPRVCRSVLELLATEPSDEGVLGLWGLEKGEVGEIEWQVREERLKKGLREIWYSHLMTDPKQRKIIIIENPMLSTKVKEMIARVLFDNLQVPSISFASSTVLSLLATGNVTGLVVDCGNLETTVLPIFASRPLFPSVLSTPRAGSLFNSRLRSLLHHFGSYASPPPSLTSTAATVIGKIPPEVLTEELIEEIKTRMCYVAEALRPISTTILGGEEEGMDVDRTAEVGDDGELMRMKALERRYASRTKATTISFRVPSLSQPPIFSGVGRGWIQVPGWVRERAAEVLFENGDEDEMGLHEVILESILRLPIDLRRPLASSILLTGGTSSMPGFIPRLRTTLVDALQLSHPPSPPPSPPPTTTTFHSTHLQRHRTRLSTLRATPHYAPLVPLAQHISILNDPCSSGSGSIKSGSAPAWTPSLLSFVGASLAGALKTGGVDELKREGWDAAKEGEGSNKMGEKVVWTGLGI